MDLMAKLCGFDPRIYRVMDALHDMLETEGLYMLLDVEDSEYGVYENTDMYEHMDRHGIPVADRESMTRIQVISADTLEEIDAISRSKTHAKHVVYKKKYWGD